MSFIHVIPSFPIYKLCIFHYPDTQTPDTDAPVYITAIQPYMKMKKIQNNPISWIIGKKSLISQRKINSFAYYGIKNSR